LRWACDFEARAFEACDGEGRDCEESAKFESSAFAADGRDGLDRLGDSKELSLVRVAYGNASEIQGNVARRHAYSETL
jgi:hypothetical protein